MEEGGGESGSMGIGDSGCFHRVLDKGVWRTPVRHRDEVFAGTRCGLCHQTRELIGGKREHAEHTVAHHLGGTADADMATAELGKGA